MTALNDVKKWAQAELLKPRYIVVPLAKWHQAYDELFKMDRVFVSADIPTGAPNDRPHFMVMGVLVFPDA